MAHEQYKIIPKDQRFFANNNTVMKGNGTAIPSTHGENTNNDSVIQAHAGVDAHEGRLDYFGDGTTFPGYAPPLMPWVGHDNRAAFFDFAISPFTPAWKTQNNTSVPTDTDTVNALGIPAAPTVPVSIVLQGRPYSITQDTFVTEVVSPSDAAPEDEFSIIDDKISGPATDHYTFVTAFPNDDATFSLRAHFTPTWQVPQTINLSTERIIYTTSWTEVCYKSTSTYALMPETGASQSSKLWQFLVIIDWRNWNYPALSNPRVIPGQNIGEIVILHYNWDQLSLFFNMETKRGLLGRGFENYQLCNGNHSPNLSNHIIRGWGVDEATEENPKIEEEVFNGGSDTGITVGQTYDDANAEINLAAGSDHTINVSNHSHTVPLWPPHFTLPMAKKIK